MQKLLHFATFYFSVISACIQTNLMMSQMVVLRTIQFAKVLEKGDSLRWREIIKNARVDVIMHFDASCCTPF